MHEALQSIVTITTKDGQFVLEINTETGIVYYHVTPILNSWLTLLLRSLCTEHSYVAQEFLSTIQFMDTKMIWRKEVYW